MSDVVAIVVSADGQAPLGAKPFACKMMTKFKSSIMTGPGARPTKHISIEFEIRWKFRTL